MSPKICCRWNFPFPSSGAEGVNPQDRRYHEDRKRRLEELRDVYAQHAVEKIFHRSADSDDEDSSDDGAAAAADAVPLSQHGCE